MDEIRLIVGLGNPGKDYERTRHNAGFWWVDAIAERKHATWKKETRFSGWTTRVEEEGQAFHLLKPSTYMNESGRSVSALVRFFRIEPASMLVVHDELDMPPGVVKLKRGGGTGGHNGLTDIADALDTKDFWRLRVGIGHPGHRDLVADYVLDKPRKVELEAIEPPFERSYDLLPWLAKGRMTDAMTWLHTNPKPASDKEADTPVQTGVQSPKDKQ